jgi:hypothetical protein
VRTNSQPVNAVQAVRRIDTRSLRIPAIVSVTPSILVASSATGQHRSVGVWRVAAGAGNIVG